MAMVAETAEAAVSQSPQRRRLGSPRSWFGSRSQETEQIKASDIQHAMYRMLLGVDKNITKPLSKYNVGEFGWGGDNVFDTHEYDGYDIKFLDDVLNPDWGIPYIAHGQITLNEKKEAILRIDRGNLNLGPINPQMHGLIETTMKGNKLAVPIVFDEPAEGERQIFVGDRVAYLTPNPDLLTRHELEQIGAKALVKGKVTKIDTDDKYRMKVEVAPKKRWWPAKHIRVGIGTKVPKYDQGEAVPGQRAQEGDELMIPVTIDGLKANAAGDPLLGQFSSEHMLAYEPQRQMIEGTLHELGTVVTNREIKTLVRANGDVWYISEPHAREAAVRYLVAELIPLAEFMTYDQQGQMWNAVGSLEQGAWPVIFEENDPIVEELDDYFHKTTREGERPKRARAMTPKFLLEEMRFMSAYDDNPLPLNRLVEAIERYQGQFGSGDAIRLVDTVLFAREEQLRKGVNPEFAVASLLEAIPYLQGMEPDYQREFFIRIINAGVVLAQDDPNVDLYGHELNTLLLQAMSGLTQIVYPSHNYLAPDMSMLLKLLPYYESHISLWSQFLPQQSEKDKSFDYLLLELELAKGIEDEVKKRDANAAIEHSEVPDDARLVRVVDRLSAL